MRTYDENGERVELRTKGCPCCCGTERLVWTETADRSLDMVLEANTMIVRIRDLMQKDEAAPLSIMSELNEAMSALLRAEEMIWEQAGKRGAR